VTAARVIGVGNRWRGDDAVGLAVADRVRAAGRPGIVVLESDGDPASLIELWSGAATVVLVDAVDSGSEPGTIRRIDAAEAPIPATHFRRSTHVMGIGEAVELGRAIGRLPETVVFYGIEARCFDPGSEMTDDVAAAVEETAARILDEFGAVPPV
jgi:hydrogenase maturation protease